MVNVRKFCLLQMKIVCWSIIVIAVFVALIVWFSTFRRLEWSYEGKGAGELHELLDKGTDIKAFRFNDYGSTNGTYELFIFADDVYKIRCSTARVVRRDKRCRIIRCREMIFDIVQLRIASLLLTLSPEFAPENEDETLEIEFVDPNNTDNDERFRLEFKAVMMLYCKFV